VLEAVLVDIQQFNRLLAVARLRAGNDRSSNYPLFISLGEFATFNLVVEPLIE
jgi:hypothetical protein